MDVVLGGTVAAAAGEVRAAVADLAGYPRWLGVVLDVEPDGDGWLVDVGAKVGPLRRAKRVRMVRVEAPAPAGGGDAVRFERRELDGADHSPWVLEATVRPAAEAAAESGAATTALEVRLHYGGGSPLMALVEPVLRAEAARAPGRLEALIQAERPAAGTG